MTRPDSDSQPLVALADTPPWERKPCRGLPSEFMPWSGGERLRHSIGAAAQAELSRHAIDGQGHEVAGLLLGTVHESEGRYLVEVTELLRAMFTTSSPVHVGFTASTWMDLLAQRAQQADKMTVGWYHSHPGLGIFLSGRDRFVHQSFFAEQPWLLALVIDPSTGEQGVFANEDGQIVRCKAPLEPQAERSELL